MPTLRKNQLPAPHPRRTLRKELLPEWENVTKFSRPHKYLRKYRRAGKWVYVYHEAKSGKELHSHDHPDELGVLQKPKSIENSKGVAASASSGGSSEKKGEWGTSGSPDGGKKSEKTSAGGGGVKKPPEPPAESAGESEDPFEAGARLFSEPAPEHYTADGFELGYKISTKEQFLKDHKPRRIGRHGQSNEIYVLPGHPDKLIRFPQEDALEFREFQESLDPHRAAHVAVFMGERKIGPVIYKYRALGSKDDYIIMEKAGPDLHSLEEAINNTNSDNRRQAAQEEKTALLRGSVDTWKRLHSLGIVHGDFHSGNIVGYDDGCRLIDFDDSRYNPRGALREAIFISTIRDYISGLPEGALSDYDQMTDRYLDELRGIEDSPPHEKELLNRFYEEVGKLISKHES